MSTLERGFKAWAERTAVAVRRELDLAPVDPLDPRQLAERLGVLLVNPRDFPDLPRDIVAQLLVRDATGWSAATLLVLDNPMVIYNPTHSPGRQASNIVHELAHIMLKHEPAKVIFSQDEQMATRTFDKRQEDEANWLGWTLLLPRDALVAARRRRMARTKIAQEYGVSANLVRYRLQVTGVDAQMKRLRKA